MGQCDDIYTRIQELQAKKRRLDDLQRYAFSMADSEPDPDRLFTYKDPRTGKEIAVDFDDLWRQLMVDPATRDWAMKAAQKGHKPMGRFGYFENMGELVEKLGFDNAVTAGAFMQRLTGSWAKADPADFDFITAVNNGEEWTRMVNEAFREAGLPPDDNIVQAIAVNGSPFLDIVAKQTKLEVFGFVTRNNLIKRINQITEAIDSTGIGPSVELKRALVADYRKAIYAHRTARLAKRRSGQLLQNYQRLVGEDVELASPEAMARLQTMDAPSRVETMNDLKKITEEIVGATPDELVQEGSLIKSILEAADKGPAGKKDLEAIQTTLKTEGVDPIGDNDFEDGWDQVWRRNARAGYKDSLLFSGRSQLLMNYISQKIVYLTEGYRAVAGQGWRLKAARMTEAAKEAQLGLGDLAPDEVLPVEDVAAIKITPLATGFFREALRDQIDGSRIAVRAALVANDAIRQTWNETLQRSFLDGQTPFAGRVDSFSTGGQLSIDDQYKVAQSVWDEKMAWDDPIRLPMQIRNKLHWGLKILGNKGIEKATGVRLPAVSSLQMMSAVDQRAGLRNYMTIRVNDLMLEQAAINPEGSLDDWAAAAQAQLDDQLYQATPTKQNIEDAREQFSLSREDLSDEEVAEYIVSAKVGMPVLNSPGQFAANRQATAMRMQNEIEGTGFKQMDQAVRAMRQTDLGDSFIAFWRSPINGIIWDLGLGMAPLSSAYRTLKVAGFMAKSKDVPVDLLVKAQASTFVAGGLLATWAALESQGLIEAGGPVDPQGARQYRERLAAEGKVPNSIMGIPFNMGGVPILNTLFLYTDMKRVIEDGNTSNWDQETAAMGIVSLLAGIILRTPAFAQVENIQRMLMDQSGNALSQFAAFWGNSQYNPASGAERMAEWGMGLQSNDLMRPARMSKEEQFTLESLEDGHPLRSQWNALRDFTYYSNPAISHWMGSELKETTWLGRGVRRPDGFFRGEWPIGVPGVWEFNKGEYVVEATLEDLGLLDPPQMIMNGMLDGVLITEDGRKQLNNLVGTWRASDDFDAFSSTTRKHQNGLVYGTGQIQYSRAGVEPGELPFTTEGSMIDVTDLMDRVVSGNTVREAMNALIQSPEWEAWRKNPLTTWDPKVVDLPPSKRKGQIGPWMLKQIKDYYADMAAMQFEMSGSQSSMQWLQDWELSRKTRAQDDAMFEALDAVSP